MNNVISKPTESSAPKAQGHRVRRLRLLAGVEKDEVEQFNIKAGTLSHWEAGTYGGGLSKNAVRKIQTMCDTRNVTFTIDWLLFGTGQQPTLERNYEPSKLTVAENTTSYYNSAKSVNIELQAFLDNNPNPVEMIVNDDSMTPHYHEGDYIAGSRFAGKSIEQLIGKECIVHSRSGEMLLRVIKEKSDNGRYTLVCSNPQTSVKKPTLYDVDIANAAYVVWHRRPTLK